MGIGSDHTTVTVAAKWIPELWEDNIVATYRGASVMRNLVEVNQHSKGKGDVIHRPNPARATAAAKAASTAVTYTADTANEITISIDKQYYVARFYERIADYLALNSMMGFYTKDAGQALAERIDAELHKVMATMQGGSIAGATNLFEAGVIGGDGSTNFSGASSGNGTALTDPGLRRAMQTLEDQNVNLFECALVVPPVVSNNLRGISRYTEQAFIGNGDAIKTGIVARLYGVDIYQSSLCPWIHCNSVTNTQSVNFSSTTLTTSYVDEFGFTVDWATSTPTDTKYRACALVHKDAIALYEAGKINVREEYKTDYIGTSVVSDAIFGCGEVRDYAGISIIVPS